MSIAAIAWSWKQDLRPTEKFILVAIADHANDEDFTCWPSLTHLETKTGYNRTTVWRTIDSLVNSGHLSRVGQHPSGATLYKVLVGAQCTQVQAATQVGAQCNGVGAHSNKVGAQDTPNHKNRNEPSGTINIARSRFVKPTVDEIRSYCLERRNSVDPQAFHAFYTSNGWKVGRNAMKDWKSAVITWEKNARKQNGGRKTYDDYSKALEDKINAKSAIRGDAERLD